MKWDEVTLVILAAFGCVTPLLAQISEVLSRLPQIIRAWRQVRHELSAGTDPGSPDHSTRGTDPSALAVDPSVGDRTIGELRAGRDES
ncbi:hypothetical protein [Streptomyces rimosus]|uniref:hypothetical protein n=1 Tax=Streptomyces rimosus TaxID=1927 RepID=UPI000518BFB9|nr:hypothetical protein [Streptomyces rimosus]